MIKNILWISAIIVILGILFFVFSLIYERSKQNNGGVGFTRIKFPYFILIFVLITGIAVTGFIYLNNRDLFDYKTPKAEPTPVKAVQSYIDDNEFDRCIAYTHLIRHNTFLDLDLISEANQKTLIDKYKSKNTKPLYRIAFVQKDNEDYIKIINDDKPSESFLFKSNLPYSFDELLTAFEEASNKELTDSFLNARDTGIFFTSVHSNLESDFIFISQINGHNYIAYYDDELIILK